ncbi:MAG: small multi-drug export protein [archaeon]
MELRLGIPFCISQNNPVILSAVLCILANLLVAPFVLFFLGKAKKFNGLLHKIRNKKKEEKIQNLGFLGLILFTAIPFPGTGAWTGSVLAWGLGLQKKKSILAISIGVVIAGILVTLATIGIISFFSFLF